MGCVCCKPSKADGPSNNGTGPQNDAFPHQQAVGPADVTPSIAPPVHKPPPPAVLPKKRECRNQQLDCLLRISKVFSLKYMVNFAV